ncbi:M42 family peptidase [Ktedonosporobacter rubrisoli]|uniref:M42 family peptidase n=1 Tax=Ktedonosporobacter rubrisoli TaxID=2509675 RepID=A0A4P6JV32_KTERU|nr:M42 family metallopeptidase [Ktedonosporobacter rubrisoli]QBD79364.1 M42 family peptidase [Ktedonosporobacter rubrisoli]
MDEARVSFLRHMISAPSPSGAEQAVQQVIREEVRQYTDEVRTDVHGNVIASLNAAGEPRVMLTAHCDELGFLIRYIDEQGFLYFAPIGGFDPATLPGNRVKILTPSGPVIGVIGRKPVHIMHGDDRDKMPKLSDLWIDIGAANKEEALKRVPLGSFATRAAELEPLHGNLLVSRALDDKSGIFTVVEAVRRIHEKREALQAGVFFVSAVQEEVGLRGARTGAFGVDPLIAIAVDVTFTSDHPGVSKQELGDIKLNGGPVLTVGGNINPRVYQLLIKAAEEAGLAYQIDSQPDSTGTDTDVIQVVRSGVATGLVSLPLRYMHTASEIVSLKDIDESAELIARFVLALDKNVNVIP